MKNLVYMIAVVADFGKEYITSGGIKKSIITVKCYDSKENINSADLLLSELSEIRKSTGLDIGDIIFFSGTAMEGLNDRIVFHPSEIYILRKGIPVEEISEKLINSRLLPYKNDSNIIVLEGTVCSTSGTNICMCVKNKNILRGDSYGEYHIWVKNTHKSKPKKGDKAAFVGEISGDELIGNVYV